jgi:hypothetical protein
MYKKGRANWRNKNEWGQGTSYYQAPDLKLKTGSISIYIQRLSLLTQPDKKL